MKNIALAFLIVFVLLFAACSSGAENTDTAENAVFSAQIIETSGSSVLVTPLKGEAILQSSDKVTFGIAGLDDINAAVGDIVTITYSGEIMESYPAQIIAISWALLEKAEQPLEEVSSSNTEVSKLESTSNADNKNPDTPAGQGKNYLQMSLDGSYVLSFDSEGKKEETLFPAVNYSNAQISFDGTYMLCKVNASAAGEGRWCEYSTVNLLTGEAYNCNSDVQFGFQNHIWLDNNIIGVAYGQLGEESIQLFDNMYNPLNVSFDFPQDAADMLAGIGYNRSSSQYIFARLEDTENKTDDRFLLSVFEKDGSHAKEIEIPQEYSPLYSGNILMWIPNNPVITADGNILLTVQKKEDIESGNTHKWTLLVISPNGEILQEIPGSNNLRLSDNGNAVFTLVSDPLQSSYPAPTVISFEDGDLSVYELPAFFAENDDYENPFTPFDAVFDGHNVYIMTDKGTDDGMGAHGLFYWDMQKDPNAEQIKLLEVFHGIGYYDLAGIDDNGYCNILLNGVVPESAVDDSRSHLEERKSRILEYINS